MSSLLLPFQIGHHLPPCDQTDSLDHMTHESGDTGRHVTNHSQRQQPKVIPQDGFLSAMIACVVLVSLAVAFILAMWTTADQTHHIEIKYINGLLSLYMVVSCILMWTFSIESIEDTYTFNDGGDATGGAKECDVSYLYTTGSGRERVTTSNDDDVEDDVDEEEFDLKETLQTLKSSIPLVSIVVFFSLGLALDILRLISHWQCHAAFELCNLSSTFVLHNSFHIVKIVFMASQVQFVMKFHHSRFRRTLFVSYSMSIIIASTVSLWISNLIFSSIDLLPKYDSFFIKACDIQPNTTVRTDLGDCILHKTKPYKIYASFSRYLFPLHIQFNLIIVQVIISILIASKAGKNDSKQPNPKENLDVSNTATDAVTDTNESTHTAPITVDNQLELSLLTKKNFQFRTDWRVLCTPVFSVIFLTFGAITYLDPMDKDMAPDQRGYTWRYIHSVSKLLFFSWITLTTVHGLHATQFCESKFTPFRGLDFLVIISSGSFFTHTFMGVIANSAVLAGTSTDATTLHLPVGMTEFMLTEKIINTLQCFLQITFLFHASNLHSQDEKVTNAIKSALLVLAIANFAIWIMDSCIEIRNVQLEPSMSFYFTQDSWNFISQFMLPPALFFRFTTFLLASHIYCQYIYY